MKPLTIAAALIAGIALFALTLSAFSAAPAADPGDDGARAAVQAALDLRDGPRWRAGAVTRRGEWAFVAATGAAGSDPLTALAHRDARAWQAALPGSRQYLAWLRGLPASVLDLAARDMLLGGLLPATGVFTQGYRLPWGADLVSVVTQGSNPGNGHLNQIDFSLAGGPQGQIVAAKSGTVVFRKDSSDTNCQTPPPDPCWRYANMIVVRHAAGEFSWYVHLAHGSIPPALSVGAVVTHGTLLGIQGETGYASGVHLHYMASNAVPAAWPDPGDPASAPWPPGNSIVSQDWCEADMAGLYQGETLRSSNLAETAPGVTLYRNTFCGLPAERFAQDDPDLLDNPVITQTASSEGLSADWAVRLFPGANYSGTFTQLGVEARDLSAYLIGNAGARSLRVGQSCQFCPGFNDAFEPDDTYTTARVLIPGRPALGHTLWITPDLDWARFDAAGGTDYLLFTARLGPRADTVLGLFRAEITATVMITENDDVVYGVDRASLIRWTAPAAGTYYLRVRPHGPENTGIDTDYDLHVVAVSSRTYLPFVAFNAVVVPTGPR